MALATLTAGATALTLTVLDNDIDLVLADND